jgi:hypothetical protein
MSGFVKVEQLPGNVGYLKLDGFAHPEHGARAADAAFAFLQDTDALIIDLRDNTGGEPRMVAHLVTRLLPIDRVALLNTIWKRGDSVPRQYWTVDGLAGPRYLKPVYLLMASHTVSAPEELAYDLRVLQRATVVGERSGGGANPGRIVAIGHGLGVFVSTERAVHPVTGTNWEGVGIAPDVAVSASEALATAHRLALEAVLRRRPIRCTSANCAVCSAHRPHVRLDVELRPGRLERHVADGAVDRPTVEGPIEAPEAPEDPAVAVRVATVERVLVVEVLQHPHRALGVLGPRDDALAPEHPQVVVHPAVAEIGALARVPQLVASARFLELGIVVEVLALVALVLAELLLRPLRHGREGAMLRLEAAELKASSRQVSISSRNFSHCSPPCAARGAAARVCGATCPKWSHGDILTSRPHSGRCARDSAAGRARSTNRGDPARRAVPPVHPDRGPTA